MEVRQLRLQPRPFVDGQGPWPSTGFPFRQLPQYCLLQVALIATHALAIGRSRVHGCHDRGGNLGIDNTPPARPLPVGRRRGARGVGHSAQLSGGAVQRPPSRLLPVAGFSVCLNPWLAGHCSVARLSTERVGDSPRMARHPRAIAACIYANCASAHIFIGIRRSCSPQR